MPNAHLCARAAVLCCLLVSTIKTPALAHVDWTRVNGVDANCIALYHLGDTLTSPGKALNVAAGLPVGRGLVLGTTSGAGASPSTDVKDPIFDPGSVRFDSVQTNDSTDTLTQADGTTGPVTIECWFKWDATMTSSSVVVGFRSAAKLQITRDTTSASLDRFGLSTVHGNYVSAPGFVDWPTVGAEEGPLGEWIHAAVTIYPTGTFYNSVSAHDVYSTGSVARFWLNGHPTGTFPFTADLTDVALHDNTKLEIRLLGGAGVSVDEFTVWKIDWSNNGTTPNPFANGRPIPAAVDNWLDYR
ncbi:MAG: LamG domain-containing protein [Candidatus Sumerlaeaceae bacterium]|nr:LamG domain-containing protein [Candidatus Sumerlaeaceae bacterium]